ncbi:MAG: hypothetical protein R2733_20115 [Acidimicrobiales bacterium]
MAWKPTVYRSYIDTLASWAAALGVEPTDVEECLFRADATGQWGA